MSTWPSCEIKRISKNNPADNHCWQDLFFIDNRLFSVETQRDEYNPTQERERKYIRKHFAYPLWLISFLYSS